MPLVVLLAVAGVLLLVLALSSLTVLAFGDLEVTFTTAPPANINAGESYSFAVQVRNAGSGPQPAEAVVFEYRPPPDVAVTSISSSRGPCEAGTKNNPSDPATCALGNMAPGASATINITVKVDPTVLPGTQLDNDVRAWQFGTEDDPPDNENHAFVNVVLGPADLRLTKISEPHETVRAGETFTYTIYVDNLGPSAARHVVISDTLLNSGRVTIQSCAFSVSQGGGAITQFTCTTGPVVSTQFGTDAATFATDLLDPLSPTSQGRLRASFRLVATEDIDVMNTTRVVADNFDPNMENNFAVDPIQVTAVSDLKITKWAVGEVQVAGQPGLVFDITTPGTPFPQAPNYTTSPTQVTAGRRISYTLTFTNTGPSTAENVLVLDRLPPGVTIYPGSLVVSQGACETGTPGEPLDQMKCGIGTIPPGGARTIRFQVLVDPSVAPGTVLNNDVLVTSDIFDPRNDDNYAHTLTTVNTLADLAITKSARGDNVTGFDSVSQQFIKTQVADQVTAGELLEYTLVVTNTGPSDAQNVAVVDTLPPPAGPVATVNFVSADGATCLQDPVDRNKVTCDLDTVAAGASRTIHILVRVDPSVAQGTVITNSATVSSTTADPNTANNTATNNTTVNAVADIYVTKDDVPAEARLDTPFEPDQAIAGLEHRYRVTIGNNGPSVAVNVDVTDLLDLKHTAPDILGETFVRCEPLDPDDLVTCSFTAPNTVTVTRLQVRNEAVIPTAGTGTLDPGDAFGFYLITKVDSGYVYDAIGDVIAEDTARIASTTTDVRTANNQDTEQTEIIAEADLSVSKTDLFGANPFQCDPVVAGGTCTYTITVHNAGPSDAAPVYVTDWLPATGLILDPTQVQVTVSNGEVLEKRDDGRILVAVGRDPSNVGAAQRGRLNAGSRETVTIVVKVANNTPSGILTNRVWVGRGFVAPLKGRSEVPPVTTPATGLANFILDPDTNRFYFFADVADIANITAAHIHRGAVGVNGPVIHTLYPGGGTFGPGSPISGIVTLSESDKADLTAGNLYANVHTTAFPAGEIRGQLGMTPDPNLSNNEDTEQTTVVTPKIKIEKTASLAPLGGGSGPCPGVDPLMVLFRDRVTFCYVITNIGDTYLTDIRLLDPHPDIRLDFTIHVPTSSTMNFVSAIDPTVSATVTGLVPYVPLAPGQSITVTGPTIYAEYDILNTASVTANPVNRGFTDLTCVPDVSAQDTALVELAGPYAIRLPVINYIGDSNAGVESFIQVQNVGNKGIVAVMFVWGEATGSSGPVKTDCSGLIFPGSAWVWRDSDLPRNAKSGIIYAVATDPLPANFVKPASNWPEPQPGQAIDQYMCAAAGQVGWKSWFEFWRKRTDFQGTQLAVDVLRRGPGQPEARLRVTGDYNGVSRDLEGRYDPVFRGYQYYAPLAYSGFNGLTSWLYIQNSGTRITSVELYFAGEGQCLREEMDGIARLAPGETFQLNVSSRVPLGWRGSVRLRSLEPLAVVVDQVGNNVLMSYNGVPATLDYTLQNPDDALFSAGSQVNYGPLIYREYQGWDTLIQVQNLSSVTKAKVKVYFLDDGGNVITTIVDWICPRGSQRFYLPAISRLNGQYVGSVRVESQDWWSPGDPPIEPPHITSVAELTKFEGPMRTQMLEAIAYNLLPEFLAFDWQEGANKYWNRALLAVPSVLKGRNQVSTELAIANVVPQPGVTDFAMFFYDQTGPDDFACQKLGEQQTEYINLEKWGYVRNGFEGSLVISGTFWEHPVREAGVVTRNVVGLAAVKVERSGTVLGMDIPGDESAGSEIMPVPSFFHFDGPEDARCTGQP